MINFKEQKVIRIIGIFLLVEMVTPLLLLRRFILLPNTKRWKISGYQYITQVLHYPGSHGKRPVTAELTYRDGYGTYWLPFSLLAFRYATVLHQWVYIDQHYQLPSLKTMSGFSSTGATILDDIEALPHGSAFWRNITQ